MKKIRLSIIVNVIIFLFVLFGLICMFFDIHFMSDNQMLSADKIEMFKFFTVDSNILMGIASLFYCFDARNVLWENKNKNSHFVSLLKLMGTVGVSLTFLVTAFFLAPTSQYPFWFFYQNSNLFFHFIVPVLSVVSLIFFEKKHSFHFFDTFLGILPIFIYSIFYIINVFLHIQNGNVSFQYDFYGFLRGGLNTIGFVIMIVYFISYFMSLVFYFINKSHYTHGLRS